MVATAFSDNDVQNVGSILNDRSKPLKERFRALFTLKNVGGPLAIEEISRCFNDTSSLLKHELAYCLGQMQDRLAIPKLSSLLEDANEEVIVRHEAGEALGAIGCPSVLPLLEKFCQHETPEISETCELAVQRIKYLLSQQGKVIEPACKIYLSVDPAPPDNTNKSTEDLKAILLNESLPLFDRYKAMFALRNKSDDESVYALGEGLKCSSALFRHEIAFVLGQIASSAAVACLKNALQDGNEKSMVRHECAEALGSIATDECYDVLRVYLKDTEAVVKESCEVALDMCDYQNSDQFQYANGLS